MRADFGKEHYWTLIGVIFVEQVCMAALEIADRSHLPAFLLVFFENLTSKVYLKLIVRTNISKQGCFYEAGRDLLLCRILVNRSTTIRNTILNVMRLFCLKLQ